MGSFNVSCVMSHQTIKEDDNVYLLPISQATTYNPVDMKYIDHKGNETTYNQYSFANSNCYADAYWQNAGPIIQGIYNDYGKFTLIDNDYNNTNLKILFNYLYNNSLKVSEGSNSTHDIAFDMKQLYDPKEKYSFNALEYIWDEMWTAMYKHRIFVIENKAVKPFAFTTIHSAAVQYCLDYYKDPEKLIIHSINEDYQEFIKPMLESLSKNESKEGNYYFMINIDRLSRLENIHTCQSSDRGLAYLYSQNSSLPENKFEDSKEVRELLLNYYKSNPKSNIIGEMESNILIKKYLPLLEHKIILGAMEDLNVKLAPTSYAGQDYDNYGGNAYLKMIRAVNKTIKEDLKAEKTKKMKY